MGLDYLKNVSPDEAMKTLDQIRNSQLQMKKYVRENNNSFRHLANLEEHKTKFRRKVFSLPAIVYWSDPKKWDEVLLSKKLQKQHPEFCIKYK